MDKERFLMDTTAQLVTDRRSSLMWSRDAAPGTFPMTWFEALDHIAGLNEEAHLGHTDWRLPNRRELFSLVSHAAINPSLPPGHPFDNVFTGYYWTGTTCCRLPEQAWYVHMGGARVFKGMKHGSYMVWPVRTADPSGPLPFRTGQQRCYGKDHALVACGASGQDGALRFGRPWPEPRFVDRSDGVIDQLTGLIWDRRAATAGQPVDWPAAWAVAGNANINKHLGHTTWRLPTVTELESLCNMGAHSPALPAGHPFRSAGQDIWTATTSRYDDRYAWVLYFEDGAVGVGFKPGALFSVWLVRDGQIS